MTHPQDLSLRDQAAGVASGELDPGEVLAATLARIEERDGQLRSVPSVFPEESQRMLAEAPRGPLYGVPIAVKDMFRLPWRGPRDGTPTADDVKKFKALASDLVHELSKKGQK